MTPQTPMLKQYFQHKAEHPGVLMAIRVGDFYEFYGEDAEKAAAALEITLTGREDGSNGRIPMAGVPYHSVEKYLARLVQSGFKVGICDQVEDPKQAKGLVRRAVTRVITPGTVLEESMLRGSQNNFLVAICMQEGKAGLATLDPSTGEFLTTEVQGGRLMELILQELARLRPAEVLVHGEADGLQGVGASITEQEAPKLDRAERMLKDQLHASHLGGFGCEDKPAAVVAASMILGYARQNQLDLSHVSTLTTYSTGQFLAMDPNTRRALELSQNLSDGSKRFTLLHVLDDTVTGMGSRLLRRWLEQPLLDLELIHERQDAVERFVESSIVRGDLRERLARIADVERLVSRCATGLATPRDLVALKSSLAVIPDLRDTVEPIGFGRLVPVLRDLGDHRELHGDLANALVDEPPITLRDGGIIRPGFDLELDKLREMSRDGKAYIARLEQEEKQKTGISSLKVGYNSVFGYYLDVPKRDIEKVPEHYIRKQTTANTERYITAELKEQENAVLGASEKATALESELFHRIRARISAQSAALITCARAVAELDVLSTLAEVAIRRNYVRPEVVEEDVFTVEFGRHPVVEDTQANFVPNDLAIAGGEEGMRLMVLTGPNMSGKSTYLRQNALIALLAQMGSYVPARTAQMGLCDAIFARIGAKDELALGQSTFMVEMLESAYILNHAGPRSFVVLDEVGRGTSTYDGLAIAWAMIERLAAMGTKTLFATHYHQLNVLADEIKSIQNYRVAVHESGNDVVWTHRVLAGGTDRSYGIHVARAAGMPGSVLERASEILSGLEANPDSPRAVAPAAQRVQMTLFEAEEPEIVRQLKEMDVNALTPVQALMLLDQWKKSV